MLTCIYVVEKMARALLPADIMEGNKILYENLQYRLITE